ncbi:hypothetical protein EHS25_007327 [Saitozyma podzolica]|uniref:mRNA stability protein n=1 Tax=Saitozyma podzolica TaxID=1890683 RepID=A0A427XMK8_9TREE|nr:hypothetical protein EHS25_007327 [Saitozyma podzolica]
MSEQDQKARRLYGKFPAKNLLAVKKDHKYFDSGDYMMAKAGIRTGEALGVGSPGVESVTHATVSDSEFPFGEHASSPRDAHPPQSYTAPESAERDTRDLHGHSTGVGIYPQETSDAKEMPGVGFGHMRRGSESHTTSSLGPMTDELGPAYQERVQPKT